MRRRYLLFILVILLLILIFWGYQTIQKGEEKIVCLIYPNIFLDEAIKDFAKNYKASSGYSIKFVYVAGMGENGSFVVGVPKMLGKLKDNSLKYDVIMVATHDTLLLEEQKAISSYLNEKAIYMMDKNIGLGVNMLSKYPNQSADLIENIVLEYEQGLLNLPVWERKKILQK